MASRRNSGAIFLVYNGKMTCTFLLFYVTCYPRTMLIAASKPRARPVCPMIKPSRASFVKVPIQPDILH